MIIFFTVYKKTAENVGCFWVLLNNYNKADIRTYSI